MGGRRITIRVQRTTPTSFDPDTRQLLRTRPNPLIYDKPAGYAAPDPPAQHPDPPSNRSPSNAAPSNTGVITVTGQKSPSAGPMPTGKSPSTSPTPLTIDLDTASTRTTTTPVA